MTKQEEIREGIADKIHKGWLYRMGEVDTAKMIMQYLHSQDVVIRRENGNTESLIEVISN